MLRQRVLATLSARRVSAIAPAVARVHTTVARARGTASSPLRPTIARTPLVSVIRTPKPQFRVLATKGDGKSLQRRSIFARALIRTFTFCGFATLTISGAVIAFFIYDASTYKEEADESDLIVPQLALNPRRGGPKNLPLAEILVCVLGCQGGGCNVVADGTDRSMMIAKRRISSWISHD